MVTCTDCGGAVLHRRLFGTCIRCGTKLSPRELIAAKTLAMAERAQYTENARLAAAEKNAKKQAEQAATEAHARALREERLEQMRALAALALPPAAPVSEPIPEPDSPPTEVQYPLPPPPPYVEPIFSPVSEDVVYEAYAQQTQEKVD